VEGKTEREEKGFKPGLEEQDERWTGDGKRGRALMQAAWQVHALSLIQGKNIYALFQCPHFSQ
jgi:hypothetical protein